MQTCSRPGRYNKAESDFEAKAADDNYLEEGEDIAFDLIEGLDNVETTARLTRHECENASSIIAVNARQVGSMTWQAHSSVLLPVADP